MDKREGEVVTAGVHVRDDVVVITDQDGSGPSVRHAIEAVLDQIYAQNPDAPRVVLYRDTTGVYEGVSVDDEGQFEGFYPLETTDTEHAVAVAIAWVVEAPDRFH